MTMNADAVRYVGNFLRWAADRQIISQDQLKRLVVSFDSFVESASDDPTPSYFCEAMSEDDSKRPLPSDQQQQQQQQQQQYQQHHQQLQSHSPALLSASSSSLLLPASFPSATCSILTAPMLSPPSIIDQEDNTTTTEETLFPRRDSSVDLTTDSLLPSSTITTDTNMTSGDSSGITTPKDTRSLSLVSSDIPPSMLSARLTLLAHSLEHPATGVALGRRKHHFRNYHNVFDASAAIDWMLATGFAHSREQGVKLGRSLADKGFIANIDGHLFDDSNSLLFRFTKHPSPIFLTKLPANVCSDQHSAILSLAYHVHENTVLKWLDHASVACLRALYPIVVLWAKNLTEQHDHVAQRLLVMTSDAPQLRSAMVAFARASDFHELKLLEVQHARDLEEIDEKHRIEESKTRKRPSTPTTINSVRASAASLVPAVVAERNLEELVYEAHPPAKAVQASEADRRPVTHPFTFETCRVELKKEFASSTKPAWVRFYNAETEQPCFPDVIAKVGDDLRKDIGVQLVFQLCEALWAAADETWALGTAPTVSTTRIRLVKAKHGFIEFVRGRTIKAVAETNSWKDIDLRKLAPTLVGAMVSGFTLGVRDRHSENWMVLDEANDPKLMQIDFGYMLMENPGGLPLDTPRLTMQTELIKLLKSTPSARGHSLFDDIRADLITAYKVLRRHHPLLVSFAKTALAAVYHEDQIESFMWGKHCFRSGEPEHKSLSWFEDKLRSQLTSVVWRRTAKHVLVAAYYGFKSLVQSS